jgi:excisionase family DNA binding protein
MTSTTLPAGPAIARENSVLTVEEVAQVLRCSKAHVCNLINGKVRGTSPLPALSLGRRRLVRRSSLEGWIKDNERRSALSAL